MSQISAAGEANRHHALPAVQPRLPVKSMSGVEGKDRSTPAANITMSEQAQRFSALKAYVRQLLEEQGVELQGAFWDEMSVEDAQAAIAEGGEWSAEVVSDRIIDFVADVSGGDPEKSEMLREAVRQGFEEARQAFGGWLPEVSERTYDLVMERFGEAFRTEDAGDAGSE